MSKKKPEISDIENYDYAWLNLGDIRKLQFHNKMLEPEWSYGNKVPELLVNTCRDPEYLHFFAKYILNINLFPIQTAVLDTLWNTQFPIMIGSRGSSKSFMLAIYAIMRAVLHQGSTIAVVGAAFRQSLVLFNYVDMIWDNAPVLRDICGGKKAAPKKDMSMATWHVGNSKVIFLPLGTGEKIRGQRACVDGETLIETSKGLIKIKDSEQFMFDPNFEVCIDKDQFEKPEYFVKTKLIPTYHIIFEGGYELICSDIHKVMTKDSFWKLAKDLNIKDFVEFTYSDVFDYNNSNFKDLPYYYDIGYNLNLQEIPCEILRSPRLAVDSFLRGFLDARKNNVLIKDDLIVIKVGIKVLCDQLQILLTKYNCFVEKNNNELIIKGPNAFRFIKEINSLFGSDLPVDFNSIPTHLQVLSVTRIEDRHLYDYHIPKGQRFIGNCILNHNTIVIADEFASISDEIFQVVVRGFASTKSAGTFESVQKEAKKAALKADGYELLDEEEESVRVKNVLNGNQIIMAGTPTFAFNHFYKYYNQYKAFIESGGDRTYIKNALGEDVEIPSNFSPKDYAIIRIPAEVLPPGMMDSKVLEQAKMTMDKALYGNEYGAVFTQDSEGFYLASLLNSATCPIRKGSMEIRYGAKLYADMQIPCVMGIDPASENDNFAICIIELMDGYRGVVYVWSTNQKEFEKMRKANLIPPNIQDYHTFCIQHIRDLMRRFNIQMIVCDAQGGGAYVREGLKDPDKMSGNDIPIFDMDDENIGMNEQGSRILKMIQFSDAKWRNEAHYGLRTDIANKLLIFPEHDASEVEISSRLSGTTESLGDVYVEILDCKTETTMIKHARTVNGTEQWNVPRIKGLDSDEINKRLKKDRFTALLLANWGCRLIQAGNLMSSMGSAKYGYLVSRGGLREMVGQNNLIVPKITTLSNGRKIIL